MKAMKELAFSLIVLAVSVSLAVAPAGAAFAVDAKADGSARSGTYVFDERGLFDSAQFDALEGSAQELANKYGMGVYLLTVSYMDGYVDPTSSQRTSFATAYYKEHKLGLNPGSNGYGDGIMFVVAADSRDYVTIAYGQGSYSFSDAGVDAMENAVTAHLSDDDWYGAAQTYYSQVGGQLAYYDRHGSAQEPLDVFDWVIRLLVIVGIPLLVTFFVIKRDRDAMKTAREQSEAGHYLEQGSLQVTASNDEFVNTTLVATPRPKNTDDDSGGWGGGGGGGFSSSGGGKF